MEGFSGASRHDALLGVIAAIMLGAWVIGITSPLALSTALGAGCVPASAGIGYALFLEPPTAR